MSATAMQCFCCKGDLEGSKYHSTFEGKPRHVCKDCGIGIRDGVEAFGFFGVTGEYFGECNDNKKPLE